MSAWLPVPEVQRMFDGVNLFERTDMLPVFLSLLGEGDSGIKPFECVGTAAEVRAALELSWMRYTQFLSNPCEDNTPNTVPVLLRTLADKMGLVNSSGGVCVGEEGVVWEDLVLEKWLRDSIVE